MGEIAYGIGALLRAVVEFGAGGHELERDRVGGVRGVDQVEERWRDGGGVARGHCLGLGLGLGLGEAVGRGKARVRDGLGGAGSEGGGGGIGGGGVGA